MNYFVSYYFSFVKCNYFFIFKGKFFDNFIDNFTDIGDAIRSSRFYYHPEVEEQGDVVSWISSSTEISSDLQNQIEYFTPYKSNHNTLEKLTKSMLK